MFFNQVLTNIWVCLFQHQNNSMTVLPLETVWIDPSTPEIENPWGLAYAPIFFCLLLKVKAIID